MQIKDTADNTTDIIEVGNGFLINSLIAKTAAAAMRINSAKKIYVNAFSTFSARDISINRKTKTYTIKSRQAIVEQLRLKIFLSRAVGGEISS